MTKRNSVILAGMAVGAAAAIIYVIDKNRATLDKAVDRFGNVDLSELFAPAVMGNVAEGDPDDFTVIGTFGAPTKAQQIRSKPKQI